MIDLSFIGKEGIIIDYEDIISLTGFNVLMYFKNRGVSDKVNKMSKEDILSNYINRTDEDISIYLKKEFDISFDINSYLESFALFRPNLLYSYKIFDAAKNQGIKKLMIHSEKYSPAIKQSLQSYQQPIEYTYGDILPVLNTHKNITYMTASPDRIHKCLNVKCPIALTIVDDFMYTADIIVDNFADELRKKNVFVSFTGVLSAGII